MRPTRMLVQRERYEEAVEIAARTAEETPVIPASTEGRGIGPVVNSTSVRQDPGVDPEPASTKARGWSRGARGGPAT